MGVRSFLIKFDNLNQIIKFFLWRKYLADIIYSCYILNYDHKRLIKVIEDTIQKSQLSLKFDKIDYGDFDIYLIGFKFWNNGIWGCITTYSVGELTFEIMAQKILKCHYIKQLPIDTIYSNYYYEPIFIKNYSQNLIKASEIYLELYDKYKMHIKNT